MLTNAWGTDICNSKTREYSCRTKVHQSTGVADAVSAVFVIPYNLIRHVAVGLALVAGHYTYAQLCLRLRGKESL